MKGVSDSSSTHSKASKAFMLRSGVAVYLLLVITPIDCAFGQDASINIDQNTLSAYAGAVVAGRHEIYAFYVPLNTNLALGCVRWGHTASSPLCIEYQPRRQIFGVWERMPWEWRVVGATFEIKNTGVSLNGILEVRYSSSVLITSFELPVIISYDRFARRLDLHVHNRDLDVVVLLAGTPTKIGAVALAPYFDTAIELSASFTPDSGMPIAAHATNVSVQPADGLLTVTGEIEY